MISTGRPSRPPLALMSSRHISSAVLITLLGAAPAPVSARLSPTLIGLPPCAAAPDSAAAPIASTAAVVRSALKHQVTMGFPRRLFSLVDIGAYQGAWTAQCICLAQNVAPQPAKLNDDSAHVVVLSGAYKPIITPTKESLTHERHTIQACDVCQTGREARRRPRAG